MSLINVVPTSPILNIDVSAVSKVVLLPAASTCVGTTYNIRDWKAACSLINKIFLSTVGLDRVDGVSLSTTQLQMTSSLEIVKIMSLGNTAWSIVGRNKTVASTLGISIRPANISLPSLTVETLTFDGTIGGAAANPKITWSNSGGAVVTYTLFLIYDPTTPPANKLPLTPAPASGDTSYTYTGTTTANYYYTFEFAGYNAAGSMIMTKPAAIQNIAFTSMSVTGLGYNSTYNANGTFSISINWSALAGATRYYVTVTDNTNPSINVSGDTASTSINLIMPDGANNHNATIALYAVNASSQQSQTSTQVIFLTNIPN
jgi:hypothetical protein